MQTFEKQTIHLGDFILFQHLFWFFGHLKANSLIFLGFGIVSHIIRSAVEKKMPFKNSGTFYVIVGIGRMDFVV
ncbi:unnamed protein product [Larinioides sclopetarius]|uniref:Cytochrome c oxidase subunit 1 n=1 Tax=Larinioides sclopetarius TaxID=280406 RepID=A0AAV1Z611_9ARAC